MEYSTEKGLIIEWATLDDDIKEKWRSMLDWRFRNDVILGYTSELQPEEDQMWCDSLSMKEIEKYREDQVKTNGFGEDKTIEDFIKEYGLEMDVWLINTFSKEELNVDRILLDVCW